MEVSGKQLYYDDLDDSESCTSSLATTLTLSEDADDLYLGAEANSFEAKKVENERKSSLGSLKYETLRDKLSISSVVDILKARECDPTQVLQNLGFCGKSSDKTRSDILARFNYQDPIKENNQAPERVYDVTKSINKTKEWLTMHHSDDDKKVPVNEGDTLAKRTALQWAKNRRRFSAKSRQSSFDLLPKVNEESIEGHSVAADTMMIRESSQEKVEDPPRPLRIGHISLSHAQLESFELEEINSNDDITEKRHPPIVSQQISGNPHESDESSSGFDEDDMTSSLHHQTCDDVINVHPNKVVETYEGECLCGSRKSTTNVRYVYDITMGDCRNTNNSCSASPNKVNQPRRVVSEVRRQRRREVAGRSAVSGDIISDIIDDATLVCKGGKYFYRRRRNGSVRVIGDDVIEGESPDDITYKVDDVTIDEPCLCKLMTSHDTAMTSSVTSSMTSSRQLTRQFCTTTFPPHGGVISPV
ncbi:uncharacterized protein LOC100187085 isoform X2 [Ciona intestinalis]